MNALEIVTDEEAAAALGVPISRIEAAKRRGEIPVLTLGRNRLIPRRAWVRWLEHGTKLQPDAPTSRQTPAERAARFQSEIDAAEQRGRK